MRTFLLFWILLVGVASYANAASATLQDVEQAIHQGDYAAAERMTRQAIAEHPGSARAHYIYAQLLFDHDRDPEEARRQAEQAQQIDPALSFTDPGRFRSFMAQIGAVARHADAPKSPRNMTPDERRTAKIAVTLFLIAMIGIPVAGLIYLIYVCIDAFRKPAPSYSASWLLSDHCRRAEALASQRSNGDSLRTGRSPYPAEPSGIGDIATGFLIAEAFNSSSHRESEHDIKTPSCDSEGSSSSSCSGSSSIDFGSSGGGVGGDGSGW